MKFKSGLFASYAFFAVLSFSTEIKATPRDPYLTPSNIICVTDNLCSLLTDVKVLAVTFHGTVGTASYAWDGSTSCPSPDGIFSVKPTGATHCFWMKGFAANSQALYSGNNLSDIANPLTARTNIGSAIQPVATIAALEALPNPSAVAFANVANFSISSDLGGTNFAYNSSGTDDNCITFPASDGHHWKRINFNYLNPDMCGAGSGATDVVIPFQAALNICGGATSSIQLYLPPKTYKFWGNTGLSWPSTCSSIGFGVPYTNNSSLEAYLDFTNNTTTGSDITYGGNPASLTYGTGTTFGYFFLKGNTASSRALWITHVKGWRLDSVAVFNTTGPCIFAGFTFGGWISNSTVSNCGSGGHGEFEADGRDTTSGTQGKLTTLYLQNFFVDVSGSFTPDYGIMIDASALVSTKNCVVESVGAVALVGIGTKAETNSALIVSDVTLDTSDLEGNNPGELSLITGTGYTGTGFGINGLSLITGRSRIGFTVGSDAIQIHNTNGLNALNWSAKASGSHITWNFLGTNGVVNIGKNDSDTAGLTYASVNGVVSEATPLADFSLSSVPITVHDANTSEILTLLPGVNGETRVLTGSLSGDIVLTTSTTHADGTTKFRVIDQTTHNGHAVTVDSIALANGQSITRSYDPITAAFFTSDAVH